MNAKIFVRPKIDSLTHLYLTYLPLDTIRFSLIIPPNSYQIVLSTFYAKKSSREKENSSKDKSLHFYYISTFRKILRFLSGKVFHTPKKTEVKKEIGQKNLEIISHRKLLNQV